jgi:hypothetical protein
MVVPAEEIIGPGRSLIQGPVARLDIAFFKGFFLSIRFEAVIGPDVNTLPFAGENLAPSFC